MLKFHNLCSYYKLTVNIKVYINYIQYKLLISVFIFYIYTSYSSKISFLLLLTVLVVAEAYLIKHRYSGRKI